jgi:beta-galactosidase
VFVSVDIVGGPRQGDRVTNPALLRHPRLAGAAPGLGYGGDYNPEQWPESTWAEDARLMREAGVTFVTVGVFSWARIEPSPGERDFGWLDVVLDLMDDHDIAVDLATATASPPAWLAHADPAVLPVDAQGRRLGYGSRQTWCPSSQGYRRHALALVEDLAARYANHPALAMWHVSNELGCHNAHCYCDVSAAAFRRWLRERYGTLDALNEAWGTAFWSQHYARWEEIEPPRISTAQLNPTQQLDFRRFSSEELLDQHRAERDALHRLSPGVPVTTNFMVSSHIDGMDYWRWAPEQDVVSNDHYLDGRIDDPLRELSLCADWTRGLAGGAPWVLMEHSTSAVNWQPANYPKRPGQMMRNSLQHVARGADSVGFFQWRASVAGAEKYHSAMLPHAGTDSRVWREVVELGAVLRRLGEVAGTRVSARVAMLLDYESMWAVQRDSLPRADLRYLEPARALYRALWDAGVTVDVCHPSQDLAGYALVLAPMLHLVTDADAANLAGYVRGGGHLLATYFSGVVDENDHIRTGGYPGAFRQLLGIRVEEFCPLPAGTTVTLSGGPGDPGDPGDPGGREGRASSSDPGAVETADLWAEDLALAGAEAVRSYADGPMAGRPAVTRHRAGEGLAWYVATRTDDGATAAVLAEVLEAAGVPTGPGSGAVPPGVEVVRRVGEDRSYLFVLNHADETVVIPGTGHDLVADRPCEGEIVVEPGGVACVREEVVGGARRSAS